MESENPAKKWNSAELVEAVYADLRRLAAGKMAAEMPGQTLSATALVHEAYLRLSHGGGEARWQNRGHFYMAAAEAMRRILIDRARRKAAVKHGGAMDREPFDSVIANVSLPEKTEELLALDEALTRLKEKDERKAKLVELRYFTGLTSDEAAEVLEISKATADRDWAFARAWLLREIAADH